MSDTSYASYDYETFEDDPVTDKVDTKLSNLFALFYVFAALFAAVSIVLGFTLNSEWDSPPDTCPDSLTFWTTWNFWLSVSVCVIFVVAAVLAKCGLFGEWFMKIDMAVFLLVCGVTVTGCVQTAVGLYKSIGRDCDTVIDLAFWQIVLFAGIGSLVKARSDWAMKTIKSPL
jgi:hypothetical protein